MMAWIKDVMRRLLIGWINRRLKPRAPEVSDAPADRPHAAERNSDGL